MATSQASETMFTELWADQTLNAIKRKQKQVQRIFNGVTDYTPFTKGKSAAGYHGPKFTGINGETVARGSAFGSKQSATNTSIDIDFNKKSGGCFTVKVDEDQQTDLDLTKEYGDQLADEILDEYDDYILKALIAGASAGNKVNFAGASTTADKITYADFKNARKVLNLAGAPQKNRFCFIDAKHESELYDIDNFISRDKIPNSNLRDGIVGKLLGFYVVLTDNMPEVDKAGDINATAAKNDSYPVLFVQALAYGWGRQKELEKMTAPNAQSTANDYSLWTIHGGAVQEQTYIYQISDQTTADPT